MNVNEVLIKPLITEKNTMLGAAGKYTFKIDRRRVDLQGQRDGRQHDLRSAEVAARRTHDRQDAGLEEGRRDAAGRPAARDLRRRLGEE
jgi:hypothetical protein